MALLSVADQNRDVKVGDGNASHPQNNSCLSSCVQQSSTSGHVFVHCYGKCMYINLNPTKNCLKSKDPGLVMRK